MQQSSRFRHYLPTIVITGLLLFWELGIQASGTPLYVLPAPSQILRAFVSDLNTLLLHGGTTLFETMVGLSIATILAVIIAIMMDIWPAFHHAVYPLLVVSQTVPIIVLAPILIIYLGFGLAPKILIIVLICFFPIAIPFSDAMAIQDQNRVNLLRSMGASTWNVYALVKIPGAMSSFFSGLKVAATYSITGAIVGEWLASSSGLGYYMLRVKNGYMLDKVFASVFMVILLSLLMNAAVGLLSRLLVRPPVKQRRLLS